VRRYSSFEEYVPNLEKLWTALRFPALRSLNMNFCGGIVSCTAPQRRVQSAMQVSGLILPFARSDSDWKVVSGHSDTQLRRHVMRLARAKRERLCVLSIL
jgi:hypothetical protein